MTSIEAEYVTAAEATKEALWLKGIVSELGIANGQVTVNCDSQSAIFVTKNHAFSEKTKYIDVKYHFIKDVIGKEEVDLKKIAGCRNPADMLTKVVPFDKLRLCMSLTCIQRN